jgi:hypothetical protein
LNSTLARSLLERAAEGPGIQHANAGGWHSPPDLFTAPDEPLRKLRGFALEALQAMVGATLQLPEVQGRAPSVQGGFRLTAWGNIIRRGHYHRQHNHPGSAWSGVYYVQAGDTSNGLGGVLELADPRPFTEMTDVPGSPYGQRVLVRPQTGLMVVFPGFLYHFVHPYQGDGERISIAFNASWHAEAS